MKRTMLRMRDLIKESGLPRETIHYYNNEGLLPPSYKVRKNSSFYGPEHLERLRQIIVLREEHFLPIKAIKVIFGQKEREGFSPKQLDYIRHLGLRFPDAVKPGGEEYISLETTLEQGLTKEQIVILEQEGIVDIVQKDGEQWLTKDDSNILSAWVRFNKIGFTEEKGYGPDFLNIWNKAIGALVVEEFAVISPVLLEYNDGDIIEVSNEIINIIDHLIMAVHRKKTRKLFSDLKINEAQ